MPKSERPALGANPLTQGIFNKTLPQNTDLPDSAAAAGLQTDPSSKSQEYDFLNLEKLDREAVTLRLPNELNDWLDDLLKLGKRRHGRKIPKELWVQAALELLKAAPIDWAALSSEDELRRALLMLLSSFQNMGK